MLFPFLSHQPLLQVGTNFIAFWFILLVGVMFRKGKQLYLFSYFLFLHKKPHNKSLCPLISLEIYTGNCSISVHRHLTFSSAAYSTLYVCLLKQSLIQTLFSMFCNYKYCCNEQTCICTHTYIF